MLQAPLLLLCQLWDDVVTVSTFAGLRCHVLREIYRLDCWAKLKYVNDLSLNFIVTLRLYFFKSLAQSLLGCHLSKNSLIFRLFNKLFVRNISFLLNSFLVQRRWQNIFFVNKCYSVLLHSSRSGRALWFQFRNSFFKPDHQLVPIKIVGVIE